MPQDHDTVAPALPPRAIDADGRLLPMSDEERRARSERFQATLAGLRAMRGETDTPERWSEVMRGIDEGRPERPLFEGRY
jgi:hypothetical protein